MTKEGACLYLKVRAFCSAWIIYLYLRLCLSSCLLSIWGYSAYCEPAGYALYPQPIRYRPHVPAQPAWDRRAAQNSRVKVKTCLMHFLLLIIIYYYYFIYNISMQNSVGFTSQTRQIKGKKCGLTDCPLAQITAPTPTLGSSEIKRSFPWEKLVSNGKLYKKNCVKNDSDPEPVIQEK